jgi:hypothetical protein
LNYLINQLWQGPTAVVQGVLDPLNDAKASCLPLFLSAVDTQQPAGQFICLTFSYTAFFCCWYYISITSVSSDICNPELMRF